MLAAKLYIEQAPGSHIPKTKSPKHPKVHAASKRPFPLLMPLRIPASPIKIGMQASNVASWAVWAKNLKKTVSNKASHPSYNVIFASLCGQASRRISATTSKTPPSCKLRNLTAERSSTNAMDGRAIKQATSQGMPVERKAPFRVLYGLVRQPCCPRPSTRMIGWEGWWNSTMNVQSPGAMMSTTSMMWFLMVKVLSKNHAVNRHLTLSLALLSEPAAQSSWYIASLVRQLVPTPLFGPEPWLLLKFRSGRLQCDTLRGQKRSFQFAASSLTEFGPTCAIGLHQRRGLANPLIWLQYFRWH